MSSQRSLPLAEPADLETGRPAHLNTDADLDAATRNQSVKPRPQSRRQQQGTTASSSMGYPPPGFQNGHRFQPNGYSKATQLVATRKMLDPGKGAIDTFRTSSQPWDFVAFIHNIPSRASQDWLANLFSEIGGIIRVHVAANFSKKGKRFGFCYFKDFAHLKEAIFLFNGYTINGFKLFVTEALNKQRAPPLHPPFSMPSKLQPQPIPPHEDFRQTHLAQGSVVTAQQLFLQNSHLAIAHNNYNAQEIIRGLTMEGVCEFQVKDLGDRLLLLQCPDPSIGKDFLKDDRAWLSNWLSFIPGMEYLCSLGGKFSWVAIEGIPFHGWCEETFAVAVEQLGTYVYSHPISKLAVKVDKAFILIHTTLFSPIATETEVLLGSKSFKLWVRSLNVADVPSIPSEHNVSHISTSGDSDHSATPSLGDDCHLSSQMGIPSSPEVAREVIAESVGDFIALISSPIVEEEIASENTSVGLTPNGFKAFQTPIEAHHTSVPLSPLLDIPLVTQSADVLLAKDTFDTQIQQPGEDEQQTPTQLVQIPSLSSLPSIDKSEVRFTGATILVTHQLTLSPLNEASTRAHHELKLGVAQNHLSPPPAKEVVLEKGAFNATDQEEGFSGLLSTPTHLQSLEGILSDKYTPTTCLNPITAAPNLSLEDSDFLELQNSNFPPLSIHKKEKGKKQKATTSSHTYATRSKSIEGSGKSFISKGQLKEAKKAWGFGKIIGLSADCSEDLILEQIASLDDERIAGLDLEVGSDDEYIDLDSDSDPRLAVSNKLTSSSHN